MSEDTNKTKTLNLSGTGKLSLGGLDSPPRRGTEVSARRGKTVQVEVRRKRAPASQIQRTPSASPGQTPPPPPAPVSTPVEVEAESQPHDGLTATERANRIAVLKQGIKRSEDSLAALKEEELAKIEAENLKRQQSNPAPTDVVKEAPQTKRLNEVLSNRRKREDDVEQPRRSPGRIREVDTRRQSKLTISEALSGAEGGRQRSLASVRRQREKARMREEAQPQVKQVRDVIIPDSITHRCRNSRISNHRIWSQSASRL